MGTSLWPVRNGVTAEGEQRVSWLKLHLLLLITLIANLNHPPPHPWKIGFHETRPWGQNGWGLVHYME